jgi:hypothetical protein
VAAAVAQGLGRKSSSRCVPTRWCQCLRRSAVASLVHSLPPSAASRSPTRHVVAPSYHVVQRETSVEQRTDVSVCEQGTVAAPLEPQRRRAIAAVPGTEEGQTRREARVAARRARAVVAARPPRRVPQEANATCQDSRAARGQASSPLGSCWCSRLVVCVFVARPCVRPYLPPSLSPTPSPGARAHTHFADVWTRHALLPRLLFQDEVVRSLSWLQR